MDPTDPTNPTKPQPESQEQNQPAPPSGSDIGSGISPDPAVPNPGQSNPATGGVLPTDPAPTPDPPTTSPVPSQTPSPYAGPIQAEGNPPGSALPDPPTQSGVGSSATDPAPIPEIPTSQPIQPVDPGAGQAGNEVGPPWMRSDSSTDNTPNLSASPQADPSLVNAPPPWQTPDQNTQGPESVPPTQTEVQTEEKQGGFPVIIFVVLILGIIIAIIAFLFTQGALPFISQ